VVPQRLEKELEVAVRQEDLLVRDAIVYRFPGQAAQARRSRRTMMARRRRTVGVTSVIIATSVLASLPTL
jgi:hypothetical protein